MTKAKVRTIDILPLCNISICEMDSIKRKKEFEQTISDLQSKRQLLFTSLAIAKLFKGFSLYFGTRLDFRLRMYPWQYLLSRTSGFLKHILQDFTSRKVTIQGYSNMLEAYYVVNSELSEK
jgi:DNA-directed RNA polymerase